MKLLSQKWYNLNMREMPEKYVSPWVDQQPDRCPKARQRASEAFKKLVMRFLFEPQQNAISVEGKAEATGRFNAMLEAYFNFL